MEQLTRLAKEAGIELSAYVEGARPEAGQLVIINGEGTLHHEAPRARSLLAKALQFHSAGARVILLNATIQSMEEDFSVFERIAVRESKSAEYLREKNYSGQLQVIPDLSFCHPVKESQEGATRSRTLFIDGVSERVTREIESVATFTGEEVLRMCDWTGTADELIALMRTKQRIVSGRFHGAIFALLAGTPVLTMPSNSWKMPWLMRDLGCEGAHLNNASSLRAALSNNESGASVPLGRIAEILNMWRNFFREIAAAPTLALVEKRTAKPRHVLAERTGCPIIPNAMCVVVGNGPSIQDTTLGNIINAFEEVVRFNNYRLMGYEECAGSRTTIWATFGRGMLPADSEPPERIIFIHGNGGDPASDGKVWRIPATFYNELRAKIRSISKADNPEKISPSSGCLVIHWLISQGIHRLHLAGFDHFSKEASKQHHYWNPKAFGPVRDHDGGAEAALFRELALKGRIRYL